MAETNRTQVMITLMMMLIFFLIIKPLSFLGVIPSEMRYVRIFQMSLQVFDSSRFASFSLSWAK